MQRARREKRMRNAASRMTAASRDRREVKGQEKIELNHESACDESAMTLNLKESL